MTIIHHAAQLLTMRDADLGIIEDGAVVIEDGRIIWVGTTAELSNSRIPEGLPPRHQDTKKSLEGSDSGFGLVTTDEHGCTRIDRESGVFVPSPLKGEGKGEGESGESAIPHSAFRTPHSGLGTTGEHRQTQTGKSKSEVGVGRCGSVVESKENRESANPQFIDASGCVVMPGFVDCHTHLVFGGWREDEFEQRLEGRTYKEIQQAGGGILATVRKTRAASEDELYAAARLRLQEMLRWGTTTCEIKSGYGLDTETELKMLRVIRRLAESGFTVVPTFLGAHSVPPEFDRAGYIDLLINEMIPEVGRQKLAQFCDVFCENFVFNAAESHRILQAGQEHGLIPKIHADEIETSGGAEVAAQVGAISAEHLLVPSDAGLRMMKEKNVIAALLPGTSLFLKTAAKSPVARMRELGLTLALGSDFNPGSCTLFAMPIVVSLACLHYGLTIKEALVAATLNAARALNLSDRKGSIEPGKDADILILDVPNYRHIPYRFAHNPVKTVILGGQTADS